MEDLVLSVRTLPDSLNRRIRSDRVRVREENGAFILTPIIPKSTNDTQKNERIAWLEEFHCLLTDAEGEEIPEFPRVHFRRELIDLTGEG